MNLRVRPSIAAAVLCAMAWTAAHADQVYRWVDKDGQVHYSQTPPAATGINAQKLDVTPPPAPDTGNTQNQQDLAQFVQQKQAADQAAEKQAEKDEQKQAQLQKACDVLRAHLALLQGSGRVFTMDAQGNRHYADDSDRAQEIQQIQDQISKYCSGG